MVVSEYYLTRSDGVKLYRIFDAIVQPDGSIVPSGLKIKKIETDEMYSVVVDVENSGFSYDSTEEPIINDEDFPNIGDIGYEE